MCSTIAQPSYELLIMTELDSDAQTRFAIAFLTCTKVLLDKSLGQRPPPHHPFVLAGTHMTETTALCLV